MRFISIVFHSLLLICTISYGQNYQPAKISKKAQSYYNQAIMRAQDGSLPLAIGLFKQSVEAAPDYVDAYLGMAATYSQLKNPAQSIVHYEKAFAIDSIYTIDYLTPYSQQLALQGKFNEALTAITKLLNTKPPKKEKSLAQAQKYQGNYRFAVNWSTQNPTPTYVFAPVNAGSTINTKESEYFPSLTIDGSRLVFTRNRNYRNEDFFISNYDSASGWQNASPLPGDVNTSYNEGAQSISLDGKWLVFTGCDFPGGFGSCDIYISYLKEDNQWSPPVNMGAAVNSDQWDSQPCLSPDKQVLYFTSKRPGGYGGADIYACYLETNGRWSKPYNLGPNINTAGNEQCPFIHSDNQTLYFTSDFLPGYGKEDIFLSRKNEKGEWGVPENLGYPINTPNVEGTLFITPDGTTAYYASDREDSKGGMDIYSFTLREDIRPIATRWVKGVVADSITNLPVKATLELISKKTGQTINLVHTGDNGEYLITLPVGSDYVFNVNQKGYLFYSDGFSLINNNDSANYYTKNIPLQPIKLNASVVLKNIYFETNKFDLTPDSEIELNKLAEFLQQNPTVKILIAGHTDDVGNDADNQLLSENRAKRVVAYLANKRIARERLTFKGFGESQPVAPNINETNRQLNRRTEMKITGL